MSLILGIDEAGRGCVIGPMIMCGFFIKDKHLEQLINLNVKDSKQLSVKKREQLYNELFPLAKKIIVKEITSATIDKFNLNTLEKHITSEIINTLKSDTVYIDVPVRGKFIPKYVEEIRKTLKFKPDIIGANKADVIYPVVSAASIIAKVERDKKIKELHEIYGDFGSGYSSDEKTISFFQNYYQEYNSLPDCVRKKWKTTQRLCLEQGTLFPV